MSQIPRDTGFHEIPGQNQSPPNAGHRQIPTQNGILPNAENRQIPTQNLIPTQTPAPNSVQDQLQAQNEHLNAQAAVLLNIFLSKARQPLASELKNDMNCIICSEPFLRGENPEVPVRLECGHIFGINCILKWLSPVSRNGNNSCPNCRKPVFDDWDKTDFPALRRTVPMRRRVAGVPILPLVANPNSNRAPLPLTYPENGPLVMVDPANAPGYEPRGRPQSQQAATLPAGFPRAFRARRVAPTVDTAETVDASANTNSVAAATEPVAPSTPLPSPAVLTEEASDQQQAVQGPQSVATNGSWPTEMPTPQHTPFNWPASTQRPAPRAGSTFSRREWDAVASVDPSQPIWRTMEQLALARLRRTDLEIETEAPAFAQVTAQRPCQRRAVANAATPAPAEAARPTEDEFNGVAAIFNDAEVQHSRQRQLEAIKARKCHMWMQFCEGVVRCIEQSSDSAAFTNHDLALTIINMKDLDAFMAERARESPTWRRILHTFPRLHTEMVTRFDDFSPLPSVNIENRIELERLLTSTRINMETLHKARWHTRLSERLVWVAVTSNHEAAVTRLTERVANISGSSRETAASTGRSGEQLTLEEVRETRRMEDYLLGRTPFMTVRGESAGSVDAAIQAGAEWNFAMTRVLRL